MAELRAKISAALNTIEKSGANLHDDTYLDKTITGLEKELKQIQVKGNNEIILFLQESSIDTFCWKNFESEEDQLQNFVFKLCKIVCQSFHQWIEKVWFIFDCTMIIVSLLRNVSMYYLLWMSNHFNETDFRYLKNFPF